MGAVENFQRKSFISLIYFVRLRSTPYVIGPTEEFGSTNLPQIASSRIIYAPIGSENRAFGFSVHTSCTQGRACTRHPRNVHRCCYAPIDESVGKLLAGDSIGSLGCGCW